MGEPLFPLKTQMIQVRGRELLVRELTADARAEVLAMFRADPLRAQILVAQHCALDGEGAPLFKPGDSTAGQLPPDVVQAVSDAALALSGLGDDSPKD